MARRVREELHTARRVGGREVCPQGTRPPSSTAADMLSPLKPAQRTKISRCCTILPQIYMQTRRIAGLWDPRDSSDFDSSKEKLVEHRIVDVHMSEKQSFEIPQSALRRASVLSSCSHWLSVFKVNEDRPARFRFARFDFFCTQTPCPLRLRADAAAAHGSAHASDAHTQESGRALARKR